MIYSRSACRDWSTCAGSGIPMSMWTIRSNGLGGTGKQRAGKAGRDEVELEHHVTVNNATRTPLERPRTPQRAAIGAIIQQGFANAGTFSLTVSFISLRKGFASFSSVPLAGGHPGPPNAYLFWTRFRAWMLDRHKHSDELRGICRACKSHPVILMSLCQRKNM